VKLVSLSQQKHNTMAKVFITRRIPEEAIELLKNAPEVAEVKVNPDNRVLSRSGTFEARDLGEKDPCYRC
jgi:hypothetical protein